MSGDVAQILGVAASNTKPPPPAPATHQPSRAQTLQGLPKELLNVMAPGRAMDPKAPDIPPAVPPGRNNIRVEKGTEGAVPVGTKWINQHQACRRWAWAPFSSSSRTDGAIFRHWVRANVEYPDYPYARFDIHLDPVTYTEDEYNKLLANKQQQQQWTKTETDQLLEIARRFELRWAVVHDRWLEAFPDSNKKIEDLQHRYYQVAAILTQARISAEASKEVKAMADKEHLLMETAAARALAESDPAHQPLVANVGTGTTNKVFDLNQERQRREYMEALWNRTKEEEEEEAALRRELKEVEAQLRKVKKSGAHILAANSAASSRNPSRSASPVPDSGLDQAFASTAPTPVPQYPYLQSGRLAPPATGGATGINKTLLNRMNQVLDECKIPVADLIPTKRVCDMYDAVRKDILTLLVLQKNVLQREGLVQSKRLKLAKMGGKVKAVDEETLLGIAPPPKRTKPPPSQKEKTPANGKAEETKSNTTTNSSTTTAAGADASSKPVKKSAPKRKRKTEGKSPPPDEESKKKKTKKS